MAEPALVHSRCVLAVQDLARSVAFYRDRLGFALEFEGDGWAGLARGTFRLMLGHCPDEVPAARIGDHSYMAYVSVTGIDALHAEFEARGVQGLVPPADQPWGMREFLLRTPDGHRIMFGEDLDEAA
ncbi:bleomycin resistance protein [Ideonella sp.]|uniref:bleomycin resistance protein n=1 Tax=Ideonella sp. TaxID=1929293 RepID=UPI0035B4907B